MYNTQVSCQSDHVQDNNQKGNNLPYHIDIEKSKAGDLRYSTFIEDIEYIRLETDPEHLVGEGLVYPCPDGFMINDHKNELTVFSKDGRYLATIGKKGRGPEEYLYSNSPKIDFAHNRVYFKSNASTIAWYSLEACSLGTNELRFIGTNLQLHCKSVCSFSKKNSQPKRIICTKNCNFGTNT